MHIHSTVDDVVERLGRALTPPLVAIDGLPCSGKSTLAERIQSAHGLERICLDEFVRPEMNWPSRDKPAYPFEYIRYEEFLGAVRALASSGECLYAPFDWDTLAISGQHRVVRSTRTVIIEGVSTLNPELCELYALRIFVESDRSTTLDAAERRGTGRWSQPWRDLFLPSADMYMESHPERRADLIVAGRGRDPWHVRG